MRICLVLASLLLLAASVSAHAADVIVVAPESYHEALTDWKAHREARGLSVQVVAPGDDVGKTVRGAHDAGGKSTRFLMLVGDVDQVPCAYRPADAIKPYESDPRIATDNPWADLDDDGIPDLALGRVPADTPEQARALLARGIAYEDARDFGTWRRRLSIIGGVGGFGASQDLALETLMRSFLKRDVPLGMAVTMTYAKPASAYCPPPAKFAATYIGKLNEGALAVAYVGHGSERNVDTLTHGGKRHSILDLSHVPSVDAPRGAPLAIFVACSTGHLDGPKDCLSEVLLAKSGGPIAVISSSRVSTPYGNGVLAKEIIDALFSGDSAQPITVGEVLLAAKRSMVEDQPDDPGRVQIEKFAEQFYVADGGRRAVDRSEHLLLYHLFGDPTVILARPQRIPIEGPGSARAGSTVTLTGTSPFAGKILVEVLRGRDVAPRDSITKQTDEDFMKDYRAANERIVASSGADIAAGAFEVSVPVGADVPKGRHMVRIFISGEDGAAVGGKTLRLRAPKKK